MAVEVSARQAAGAAPHRAGRTDARPEATPPRAKNLSAHNYLLYYCFLDCRYIEARPDAWVNMPGQARPGQSIPRQPLQLLTISSSLDSLDRHQGSRLGMLTRYLKKTILFRPNLRYGVKKAALQRERTVSPAQCGCLATYTRIARKKLKAAKFNYTYSEGQSRFSARFSQIKVIFGSLMTQP